MLGIVRKKLVNITLVMMLYKAIYIRLAYKTHPDSNTTLAFEGKAEFEINLTSSNLLNIV